MKFIYKDVSMSGEYPVRMGALMRAYSPRPEGVPDLAENLSKTVQKLSQVGIWDVQIEVWADENNPAADCGETYEVLRTKLGFYPCFIHKVEKGDLFVSALNWGIQKQAERGLTHSLILSWEAASYIDTEMLKKTQLAIAEGALAIGVALPEIAEFVRDGSIMNTLAVWNIKELWEVGGFDPHDTKPKFADHYSGSNAGVGEFIPLLKIYEKYKRPVFAVILPTNQGKIEVPPERAELQRKKIESKRRRIDGMLKTIGKTAEDLKATIMPGYPV